PPLRASVIRRPSPAPWQPRSVSATNSPRSQSATIHAPPGFGSNPQFTRAKSSTASPFSSPRPSPRLAFATPQIPHSPSLSAYQFSEPTSSTEQYGDYGSDNVDWIVNDDASSNASFGDSAFGSYPSDWVQPSMVEMSTYDMLRSVLRDEKSDEELEHVLQLNGYDFSQTIMALADPQALSTTEAQNRTYLVGKSMSPTSRPLTPSTQSKSGIVCNHDLSNHLCKYWLAGTCLAGESCIFSHDPSALMTRLTMDDHATPPSQSIQPNFQLQDYDSFPALQPTNSNPYDQSYDPSMLNSPQSQPPTVSTLNPFAMFVPSSNASVQSSRPNSRHQSRTATPSTLAVNDDEAFPTLGSAAASRSSRRHGKRGHGNTANKESPVPAPSSLADVVRMTPSPSPQIQSRRGLRPSKSNTGSRENSAAAMAIAAPEHIPWLETGESANKAYLKARAEAFRHGGLRNKFLQSASTAWNRNDARGAKALSLRGHNENLAMKEAHREAARCLYEERNKGNGIGELYVDLH
ncbi:hypothetical protein KCU64_g20856, partial [Aureobasidium melanogenum]